MTPTKTKLRPAIKYHGGKYYLARRIIQMMPAHTAYLEPFCGAASVLLNKPKCGYETLCDTNDPLINMYGCMKDYPSRFASALGLIEYGQEAFDLAKSQLAVVQPRSFEAALCFYTVSRMSRGGLGKDLAWSDRLRGGKPGDLNAWDTAIDQIPAIAKRLECVYLRWTDFRASIRTQHGRDTLIYADPPYLHETRTAKKVYAHEMAVKDHMELLDLLLVHRGPVMLSGYHSSLYDDRLTGWHVTEFAMKNHSGQGKTKQDRTEVVWSNFVPPGAQS